MIRIPPTAQALVLLALALGHAALRAPGTAAAAATLVPLASAQSGNPSPLLSVVGRHFVDPSGRVVILRGVSLSGGSKVPPFQPIRHPCDLDPLVPLGFNVIRLLFVWEAYEPAPGCYDEAYLAGLQAVAHAAWERGIYVVVDIHQDGYSRFASRGSGDGFPAWAVSPRGRPRAPDNSIRDFYWPLLMASDPTTYKSFTDFYSDAHGVRSRYFAMLDRVAWAFRTVPGVIGYDLLNEPWGHERRELAPLYIEAAALIHARQPSAIIFIEGQLTTNSGLQTRLPRLPIPNLVYAPHYYKPLPIVLGRWYGVERHIKRAFSHMFTTAELWNTPLFVGEFGMPAGVENTGEYMTVIYDFLDASLASGAQWNYTPTWSEANRDGWNFEDFNIIDRAGRPRPNFRPRPFPRLTAGVPVRFAYREASLPDRGASLEYVWSHCPERGATEVFVPAALFPAGTRVSLDAADATWVYDPHHQLLVCRAPRPALIGLRLDGPVPLTSRAAPRQD